MQTPEPVVIDTNGIVPRPISILGTNYDGSEHWRHEATLQRVESGLLVTSTPAGVEVATESGAWNSPFDTTGHYWPDRWYNAIRLETPGKGLDGWYCNIATPVRFDGLTLSYVDLQLDVRVFVTQAGWETRLVDEDEFEAARERYAYPAELVERCRRAVDEVMALIDARVFPFGR